MSLEIHVIVMHSRRITKHGNQFIWHIKLLFTYGNFLGINERILVSFHQRKSLTRLKSQISCSLFLIILGFVSNHSVSPCLHDNTKRPDLTATRFCHTIAFALMNTSKIQMKIIIILYENNVSRQQFLHNTYVNEFYKISRGWILGPELCDMWTSSDVLCCTASILHLVAIARQDFVVAIIFDKPFFKWKNIVILLILYSYRLSQAQCRYYDLNTKL
ncbi:5-hydroxytryptamine receptor-like [Aphis craccivora]|uniref:5-hydroxytryptamine receptor-like n=1 Tax=Aphis craccivora TaxID=307492 RepID=A0A6G0Z2W2_APHCR|nr:5-hydroxytryptamine receptor-like [Aphis craccivora]